MTATTRPTKRPTKTEDRDANGLHEALSLEFNEGVPGLNEFPRVGRVNPRFFRAGFGCDVLLSDVNATRGRGPTDFA